jgi:hypothetical protein
MTAKENKYDDLPGNTGLTIVVDVFKCLRLYTGGAYYLQVRFNRDLAANEGCVALRVTGTRVRVKQGSVKMGQAIERPYQEVDTVSITGFSPKPGTNRRQWYMNVPPGSQPLFSDFLVYFTRIAPLYQGAVTPVLHWGAIRQAGTGLCTGGY